MVTALGIFGVGDVLCQSISKKEEQKGIDFRRMAIFAGVGMFYFAPLLHAHYSYILPAIAPVTPNVNMTVLATKKVLFDQLVFAPFALTGFFMTINSVEGKSFEESVEITKEKI